MKLLTISLSLYLSVVLAENRLPRAQLKNLGISAKIPLPHLGNSRSFFPTSVKNSAVTITKTSSSPTGFGFSSPSDGVDYEFTSHSTTTSTGDSGGTYDYPSQSVSSSGRTYSFSSQGHNGITADIPGEALQFFDKNVHVSEDHVPPFPIIPVNLSFTAYTEEHNQKPSDNQVPPHHIKFTANFSKGASFPHPLDFSAQIPIPQVPLEYTDDLFGRAPQPQAPVLSGESVEQILEQDWNDFRVRFNKVYATEDEARYRREIFIENRAKIMRFNAEYAEGKRSFVHKINEFADMLQHEFSDNFNGFNRTRRAPTMPVKPATTFVPSANVVFPESVDWRIVGAVGPVKSQKKCAACWAFAAAGALEGHHFRKTGTLVDISVQNLIDCTEPYGNNGCSGGLMDPAFEYVRNNNGVDSDPSYPFEEKTGTCRFRRENVVATCTGFVDIGENDEKGLEIAVATLGPVTAAIDAGKETFQFYSEGIYDDPNCGNKPEQMNHAVLIVGYGQEADGRKYWLVKNSYGPNWGIGGYIKIAKENNNQCGIAIQASYPLV